MDLSQDFYDLLTEFAAAKAEYLLIGGYAVSLHSKPRYTKDVDIWVGDTPDNLLRVKEALEGFGAPEEAIENVMTCGPEEIVWFGSPPTRVDIMKTIPGVEFKSAYARRMTIAISDTVANLISIKDLILAKKASGRKQDLIDIDQLNQV